MPHRSTNSQPTNQVVVGRGGDHDAPTFKHVGGNFIDREPKVLDLTWSKLQCFEVGRLDSSTQYGQRFPDQLQFDGIKVPKLDEFWLMWRVWMIITYI